MIAAKLNPNGYILTPTASANLADLCVKLNKVEEAYGRPFYVTSGVRSMADHQRIYADINKRRAEVNLAPVHIPTHSHHLVEEANAADINDSNKSLWNWCMGNLPLLEQIGLWLEMRQGGWVHFQRVPPASGKRVFIP